MRKLFAIVLSLFAAFEAADLFLLEAPPPPPPQQPLGVFRTRLVLDDPDRNWVYVWAGDGSMDDSGIWTVNGQPYQSWTESQADEYYDCCYHGGYTAAKAGPATIDVRGKPEVALTVAVSAVPQRKPYPLPVPASFTAAQMQALVGQGWTDFTFQAGCHVWDRQVNFKAGTRLYGYQATIRRLANHGPGESPNYPTIGTAGPDVSVYGFQFVHDAAGMVFDGMQQPGLVVGRCHFLHDAVGQNATQALVYGCVIEGGGAGPAFQGLWVRNRFVGPQVPGTDSFQYWSNTGLCMVDNLWQGTTRGVVGNGPQSNQVHVGNQFTNIIGGATNTHEINLVESGAVTNCAYLHTRVVGCFSNIFQFDRGADGVTIWDYQQEGGNGIIFDGQPGTVVKNVNVKSFECRFCGIACGANTGNVTFQDGDVIGFLPTRGNQSWPNPGPWSSKRRTACLNLGPASNTLMRVGIAGTPAGMTDQVGFAVVP